MSLELGAEGRSWSVRNGHVRVHRQPSISAHTSRPAQGASPLVVDRL